MAFSIVAALFGLFALGWILNAMKTKAWTPGPRPDGVPASVWKWARDVRRESESYAPTETDWAFWTALIWRESLGDPDAVGSAVGELGLTQLTQGALDDVHTLSTGTHLLPPRVEDLTPDENIRVAMLYARINKRRLQSAGEQVTAKKLARMHNGGPNGYEMPETAEYGNDVIQKRQTILNG